MTPISSANTYKLVNQIDCVLQYEQWLIQNFENGRADYGLVRYHDFVVFVDITNVTLSK